MPRGYLCIGVDEPKEEHSEGIHLAVELRNRNALGSPLFLLGCIAISGERAIGELRMASFSDVVGAPVPVQVPAYM